MACKCQLRLCTDSKSARTGLKRIENRRSKTRANSITLQRSSNSTNYKFALTEIDNDIVNKTIEIRKNIKIALPDAIIAATALVYDFTLLSRNAKDFKNIPELKLQNPWEV